MLFSSPLFLYLFLPLTLLGYYCCGKNFKNYWLLFTSLVFFAWGGVSNTLILLVSIALNYFLGLKIQKYLLTKRGYWWLFTGVSVNLLILGIFKYTNFIIQNTNSFLGLVSSPEIQAVHIILPIGISFYTFHSLSYLIDIYRQKTQANAIFWTSPYISACSPN